MGKAKRRFEILHSERVEGVTMASVLRDTETGAQYLFMVAGYAGGLTPLLDRDGKPVVSGPAEEQAQA